MRRQGAAAAFLIGPRACGKSSAGEAAARLLGMPFRDTDALVEAEAGRSVAAIVAEEGWEAFRRREADALRQAAEGGGLIATGGGAVLREENRRLMRASGTVIYLHAPAECLCERLLKDGGGRPSLTGANPALETAAVLGEREPLYKACAHHTVDAAAPPETVVRAIAALLGL